MLFSVLQLFISKRMETCYNLKVRELTMGSLSISDYSRHSYLVAKAMEYKD